MRAYIVAGLGWGDEGKGAIVDYLCRTTGARLVVRYNGGPQAAHNVVTPEGLHHTFAQFGSGTFIGARTHLSNYMLIEPYSMCNEADVLEGKGIFDPLSLITIEDSCLIITPWQQIANKIRELSRGSYKHGSCGMGIGETKNDSLCGYTFQARDILHGRYSFLDALREQKIDDCKRFKHMSPAIDNLYEQMKDLRTNTVMRFYERWIEKVTVVSEGWLPRQPGPLVFEGAQGVLLDENFGFMPRCTWSNCTFTNADFLLEGSLLKRVKIAVLRPYMTRHGAGAFPTEDSTLVYEDRHNKTGPWQGAFRLGYFDAVLLRYALLCLNKVDYLALTHLDQMSGEWRFCNEYENAKSVGHYTDAALAKMRPIITTASHFQIGLVEDMLRCEIGIMTQGESSKKTESFIRV